MTDQPTTAGQPDAEAAPVVRRETTAIDGRLPEALLRQFAARLVIEEPVDSEGEDAAPGDGSSPAGQ